MKILSISIAAYNSEKYLDTCINSLIKSKYFDLLDIMIINDGSKDNTSKIAHDFETEYPGSIRAIDKENGGHGSTINTGIANAQGKYFKLLDSDDSYVPEELDKLVFELQTREEDLVLTNYFSISPKGDNRQDYKCITELEYNKTYDFETYCKQITIAMHSFTFKTDVLKAMNNRIDEHCYYVDVEYTLYPLQNVHTFIAYDLNVYRYVVGYSEQSVNINSLIKNRKQHLKVAENVVDYFNVSKNFVGINTLAVIKKRILQMISIQYLIYFAMEPTKETCFELQQFDYTLNQSSKELYDDISELPKKNAYFLSYLRKVDFKTYVFIAGTPQKVKSAIKKVIFRKN